MKTRIFAIAMVSFSLVTGLVLARDPNQRPTRFAPTTEAPQNSGSSGQCFVPAAEVRRSFTVMPFDGPMDVFNPSGPREVRCAYSNTGAFDVELHILEENETVPQITTIPAGASRSQRLSRVTDIQVVCPGVTGGERCDLDLHLIAIPSDQSGNGGPLDLKAWYIAPCLEDMQASFPETPTQPVGCIWGPEDLWLADEPQDVQIEIDVTGTQDVKLEVEYANNTFWSYNLHAAPALPSARWTIAEEDDVIAVRVQCSHSSNPCDSCDFTWSVCPR